MLSCDNTQEEHTRALKKVRVDNAMLLHSTQGSVAVTFSQGGWKRTSCASLTPPPSQEANIKEVEVAQQGEESGMDDEHDHITTEAVSPADTAASSERPSHEEHDNQDQAKKENNRECEEALPDVKAPTRTSVSASSRSSVRLSGLPMATPISFVPLPVSTHGAITTLHTLSQLEALVSSSNTTSAREKIHPGLRLKMGESVMLLLHFGEASLNTLINAATSELSQMRVFTLDLAKLPPQDYELSFGKRTSAGNIIFHAAAGHSDAATTIGVNVSGSGVQRVYEGVTTNVRNTFTATTTDAASSLSFNSQAMQNTLNATPGEEEEEEDEEVLVPAAHPMAVAAVVAEGSTSSELERPPSASAAGIGVALTFDGSASVSSLSGDLHHAGDIISEKLRQILSVDTILNPHGMNRSSKTEPLLFPAMIVWRAAGAPREEYPPAPPQTYSSQPLPTPPELFCDRMSTQGGPLVVKEATNIDQVHSLTLFRPVYTLENLFRTLVRSVAPSYARKAPGDKSRTVLYLGASWCPPCMRFVHEMPQFMREDLPASVVCTVKADMDLAKPIYDYFKVEIIPSFVVLDNEVLMKCYDSLQERGMADSGFTSGVAAASHPDYLHTIQDAFSKAELARLQTSNRLLVSTFVSKHSQTLSFDEDF